MDSFVALERGQAVALVEAVNAALAGIGRVLRGTDTLSSGVQVRGADEKGNESAGHADGQACFAWLVAAGSCNSQFVVYDLVSIVCMPSICCTFVASGVNLYEVIEGFS